MNILKEGSEYPAQPKFYWLSILWSLLSKKVQCLVVDEPTTANRPKQVEPRSGLCGQKLKVWGTRVLNLITKYIFIQEYTWIKD